MSDAASMPATETLPLTEQMRAVTREDHDLSNKLVNLKLLVALTSRTIYGQSLLLFYYVFAQIELSMQAHKDDEKLKALQEAFKSLARSDAVVKDLDFYLGEGWDKKYKAPPAVEAYVARIQEVEKKDPIMLLAYTYHLYIALLAGGQIVKKAVKKSFGLEGETGLQLFVFEGKSKMALRSAFKDALNAIEVDADTKQRLMKESRLVFKMNNDVIRGIEGTFRQFMLWVMKYVIAFSLIYWTYVLFVKHT